MGADNLVELKEEIILLFVNYFSDSLIFMYNYDTLGMAKEEMLSKFDSIKFNLDEFKTVYVKGHTIPEFDNVKDNFEDAAFKLNKASENLRHAQAKIHTPEGPSLMNALKEYEKLKPRNNLQLK